jgi:3',5'-nucleoside bisphosphate phosphatase
MTAMGTNLFSRPGCSPRRCDGLDWANFFALTRVPHHSMSRLDLHLHTTHSDGSLPPAAVLALAHKAGVTALAITDHDITTGIPEALQAGASLGIEVIPGVEISSRFGESELHILGYFLDWQDQALHARLAELRASRHDRNPQIIERLRTLGHDITYDEVRELAGTESVGRPHIARVLMNKGYVKTAKEAFDRFLAQDKPAYVPRQLPDPAEAMAWIRAAKGVPVLAHPLWAKQDTEGLFTLCKRLKAEGLGGMEVHYSTHNPKQTAGLLDIAKRLDLLVTGGSDFHGLTKPDIEVGIGRGSLTVPTKLLEPLKRAASV